MSTTPPSEFDKELLEQLPLVELPTIGGSVRLTEADVYRLLPSIKQAVDKYVIGEDEYYGTGTPHRTENKLKGKQRQSLYGDKL